MAKSFPMNGGDGTHSYTKNSKCQKQASDSAKDMMKDAIIEKLDTKNLLPVSTTFSIVDFGCAVGPNTFFTVQNLIEAVEEKCSLQGLESGKFEFHVFFSDHTGNDFNTLFGSLPPDRRYYAAGAPGSFYSRHFPHASINLATEGIIDKAEVDAFNLPIYFSSAREMRQVIEKNGCFSIETIEMRNPTPQGNGSLDAHSLIMHLRAAMGEVFTKHFGSDVVKKMFEKALERSDEIRQCSESGYSMPTQLFVVLKRI